MITWFVAGKVKLTQNLLQTSSDGRLSGHAAPGSLLSFDEDSCHLLSLCCTCFVVQQYLSPHSSMHSIDRVHDRHQAAEEQADGFYQVWQVIMRYICHAGVIRKRSGCRVSKHLKKAWALAAHILAK